MKMPTTLNLSPRSATQYDIDAITATNEMMVGTYEAGTAFETSLTKDRVIKVRRPSAVSLVNGQVQICN